MKKLFVDNGLLLTDMELTFRGEQLILQRVLVDTGSGSTIISTDLAEKIGIIAEENDIIYRISGVGGSEFVFSKTVNSIKIGNMEVQSFTLEVGAMNYDFNLDGIIGLDLLQEIKAIINIDMLTLDINK
ncbi:retropepsin-like aspartic protease [Mesobacillus stamsii]|uniref:Aspartyl protease n=1 Tax=Mesobacillus stamsii TaxID=225347 RepID=A0ABU0FVV1_9BACI|nr:retropepsin-like aspartic protease [Mesobacillus stamsii]MDQ0414052.1 putative aspartyl protease [Mesobacillus stamsii]